MKNSMHHQRGFSLLELMIAVTLGIIIVGGVGTLFISNQQTNRTQEALSDTQESGRLAFEFIARDIRMAGSTGCPRTDRVANVLESKNSTTDWWADAFGPSIIGYEGDKDLPGITTGTASGNRVAGTDAITIRHSDTSGFSIAEHNPNAAQFKLNKPHTLKDNDVIVICDSAQASLFQITNANTANVTIVHNEGTGNVGNCSKFLGHPDSCLANAKTEKPRNCPDGFIPCEYTYGSDSSLALYQPVAYFIGNNAAGNRSLYRVSLVAGATATQELVEGVWDMQILYGVDATGDRQVDNYLTANNVANWSQVVSVQVNLLSYSPTDNVAAGKQTYTYGFGTTTATTATDRRLRKDFSGTAFVRTPN